MVCERVEELLHREVLQYFLKRPSRSLRVVIKSLTNGGSYICERSLGHSIASE
jgi:hypothetical protein